MRDAEVVEWIRGKYESVSPAMNERSRRQWAASEARSLGWGIVVGKVLSAAAMTYVAATITAVLTLLYYALRVSDRRN